MPAMFIKATVPIVVTRYGQIEPGRIIALPDAEARSLVQAGTAVPEDIEELARKSAAQLDVHPPPTSKGKGFGQAVAQAVKARLTSRSRKEARHSSFSAGRRFADRLTSAARQATG
jgi:hypothetical protein